MALRSATSAVGFAPGASRPRTAASTAPLCRPAVLAGSPWPARGPPVLTPLLPVLRRSRCPSVLVIAKRRGGGGGSSEALTPYQGPKRVFGSFKCPADCTRKWLSAFSWANKGQECQRCGTMVYPYDQRPLKKRETPEEGEGEESGELDPEVAKQLAKIDSLKPHPEELCQKCQELGYPCTELGGRVRVTRAFEAFMPRLY